MQRAQEERRRLRREQAVHRPRGRPAQPNATRYGHLMPWPGDVAAVQREMRRLENEMVTAGRDQLGALRRQLKETAANLSELKAACMASETAAP
jgi:hypothetical protein